MPKLLFLLGRPGSGKSTTAKYIKELARIEGLGSFSFKDHIILERLFQEDTQHKRFRPDGNGFFVKDKSAFIEALERLKTEVVNYIHSAQYDEVITIEFAREDYSQAIHRFPQELLEDAYFLCIDTHIKVCKRRVNERAKSPMSPDDHAISEKALQKHYKRQLFPKPKGAKNIWVVKNNGSWEDFANRIDPLLNKIIKNE